MTDLLSADRHFAFGENWQDFISLVDQRHIDEAIASMQRLFPNDEVRGARVLDIGSGSGLFLLSANMLGAAQADGVDIDKNSVAATRKTMESRALNGQWSANLQSVFDTSPAVNGQYDIVYSWGVLHHTGDMWRAIDMAARLVRPGGRFAIALYRKTALCSLWRLEKRFYSQAPRWIQRAVMGLYKALYRLGLLFKGKNPISYVRNYRSNRGMNWDHDVHDWLGGYPYESASPKEVQAFFAARGFRLERQFVRRQPLGIFGAGCDEFVFVNTAA